MIYTASKLYDKLLKIYTTQDDRFSENEKKRISVLNRAEMLTLDYDEDDLQEGEEEVKLEPEETIAERIKLSHQKRKRKGTRLKILTSKKLLIRLPILLAQIKVGNISCKLKNEIRQILDLLYQHNKITKKVYNNLLRSL